jgi:sugar (pentulose or hexulose) kinase
LRGEIGPAWLDATGNVHDPSNTAAQLLWMSEHEPESLRIIADLLARPVLPVAADHASPHQAAAIVLGQPVPPPAVETADRTAMSRPGPAEAHYDGLAAAHAQLWQALSPTFAALADPALTTHP